MARSETVPKYIFGKQLIADDFKFAGLREAIREYRVGRLEDRWAARDEIFLNKNYRIILVWQLYEFIRNRLREQHPSKLWDRRNKDQTFINIFSKYVLVDQNKQLKKIEEELIIIHKSEEFTKYFEELTEKVPREVGEEQKLFDYLTLMAKAAVWMIDDKVVSLFVEKLEAEFESLYTESGKKTNTNLTQDKFLKVMDDRKTSYWLITRMRKQILTPPDCTIRYSLFVIVDAMLRFEILSKHLEREKSSLWDEKSDCLKITFDEWNRRCCIYEKYVKTPNQTGHHVLDYDFLEIFTEKELKSDVVFQKVDEWLTNRKTEGCAAKSHKPADMASCPIIDKKIDFSLKNCCFGGCGFQKRKKLGEVDQNLGGKKKNVQIRKIFNELIVEEFKLGR